MKIRRFFQIKFSLLSFTLIMLYVIVIAFGFTLMGCNPTGQSSEQNLDTIDPIFQYNRDAFPDAKPWTSEDFKNNRDNFQFVIIGDRTGGANAQGTFRLAMSQINLLQPEFVINVGDLIEGYPENRADLNGMWDEADSLLNKLEMPFFRTIGNHDVSTPETKEVWIERHGVRLLSFCIP